MYWLQSTHRPPPPPHPPSNLLGAGPRWDKLFLAPTEKLWALSICCLTKAAAGVQSKGLAWQRRVLWVCGLPSLVVAVCGKLSLEARPPGHARLLRDLPLWVWGQPLQHRQRGQALWGGLQPASYFQTHFGVGSLLQFSGLKVTSCFSFIVSLLSSFFLPWNFKSQLSIFWLYSLCQSCNITFQIWQYHLLTSPYEQITC